MTAPTLPGSEYLVSFGFRPTSILTRVSGLPTYQPWASPSRFYSAHSPVRMILGYAITSVTSPLSVGTDRAALYFLLQGIYSGSILGGKKQPCEQKSQVALYSREETQRKSPTSFFVDLPLSRNIMLPGFIVVGDVKRGDSLRQPSGHSQLTP